MGLQLQSWPEPVLHQELSRKAVNTLTISKFIQDRLESGECSKGTELEEYNECLLAWHRREIAEDQDCQGEFLFLNCGRTYDGEVTGISACKVLQFSDKLYANASLAPCVTQEDYACSTGKMMGRLMAQGLGEGAPHSCRKPCRLPEYRSVLKSNPDYRRDFLKVFVEVGSNDVTIMEEYLVYDFNDIVSSVGGSLGLFLGFSCLEACRMASKMLSRKRKKANIKKNSKTKKLKLPC